MLLPLVSVVMSVYNSEKYLEEAIDSILTQTYDNFEFIIINDGSTDNSLEIIKKYMKIDNRITLINRKNKGLPYSLNEGIEKAKGKYIARMDADDISLNTRLKEQTDFMENNNDIGICGTWVETFGDSIKSKISKYSNSSDELKVKLLFSNPFAHPSVIIRKEILVKYNLKYNLKYTNSQDYELWSRLSKYAKMSNIQKVLLKYRISDNSITVLTKVKNDLKYELSTGVYKNILKNLNIVNTEKENKLHFNIGQNYRIKENNINILLVDKYFKKIIKENEKVKLYGSELLYNLFSEKFINVTYLQFRRFNFYTIFSFTSSFFWFGLISIIKRKL